uniref:isopeptide-forming domain-containing fimbrial protein n=1 Tax=Paucisalibacillus sp. EB02 TaxID=1347087 RepID=UPI0006934538
MKLKRKWRKSTNYISVCLLILLVIFNSVFPSIALLTPAKEVFAEDVKVTNANSNWLTYKFDEFSNNNFNQLFTANGSAGVPEGSDFIRLTPAEQVQTGAVFNNEKICPVNNYSFSTAFSFMMSNPSAEGPSDGMTFTLQTGTTSQLVPGGSLGYYGLSPSFTIKYDTFLNDVYNDPSSNYIGIAQNGELVNKDGWYTDLNQYNAENGTNFVLSNGTMYYTWIDYDSSAQNVQVHLGTSPDRASANKVLDVNGIDLSTIFGGQPIHAGFTGSTGSPNYENHDIHSWYFVNNYAPITTLNPQNDYKQAPSSVALTTEPTSDPGVYNVTATLTDSLGNPVSGAFPDSFATSSGELTGPNGEPLTDLVSDAEGNIHAVLVNADHSTDVTVSASVNCIEVSETIPASEQPPEVEDPPVVEEPPAGSCPTPVALFNGSFEEPPGPGSMNGTFGYYEYEVPGWNTTDDTGGVKWIEIWDYKEGYPEGVVGLYPAPPDGNRYAELNASGNGMLYQDVQTTPGQTIYWRLSHKGLTGVDTMQLRIGPVTDNPFDTSVIEQMSDGNTAWGTYTGTYTVPAGQTSTRFGFEAVSTANGSIGHGNHIDDIFLGTEPCIVADKTVAPEGEVYAGQELTYEVTIKNQGGDIAAGTTFEDVIPVGTEYVPGSLKIIAGPGTGDLTDEVGDDAGRFDGEKVIIELGDLPNTTNLPDGITVQFKVRALDTDTESVVSNKALINYDNLLTNESETTETNETTTTVLPREEINACAAPVALINGSFEEPAHSPEYPTGPGYFSIDQSFVPGWQTTDSTGRMEIFNKSLMDKITPGSYEDQQGLKNEVIHGKQFAELNSKEPAQLYQDVETTPGQVIYWRLAHKGRLGDDTMAVKIGSAEVAPRNLSTIEEITTGKDTWQYYSGMYTVPADQIVTRFGFESIFAAGGNPAAGNFLDDIFLGTEPCVVAEKTVSPEGEVFAGQELTYEITVQNNGGDIAASTVVEDAIPAGTEYVPGSLKIIDGPGAGDLTDQAGDDAGHYDQENNKVIIELGDLPNTNDLPDGITIQFKVMAIDTDTESVVSNKALINYENLLTNESETTETNETTSTILPREEINACLNPVALVNGSFEDPVVVGSEYSIDNGSYVYGLFPQDVVPGWKTTASDGLIELWDESVANHPFKGIVGGVPDGKQVAELNANEASALYQDVSTTPGQTIYWRLKHQGGADVDTMVVKIGSADLSPDQLPVVASLETGPDEWKQYSGIYTVPFGQTATRFSFESTDLNDPYMGNILDDIFLGTEPCVVGEKSVSPNDSVYAGDELTYEVTMKNHGGDVAANTIFEDAIPTGTEYVPGSLKIIDGPGAGDLTDQAGDDAGRYDEENNKVIIELGDLPNTNELPDGVTVQFKVRALVDDTISEITNKAQIGYDNLLTNESETTESNETTTGLTYHSPVLDSQKEAEIAQKAEGNTDLEHPEVGDTLLYTIQTRNTITNSLVKNLIIHDSIPEGLEYVPGSLIVDNQAVTDEEGDDAGHILNGQVVGQLGDITDTEWHTVTFQVIVGEGQASQDIINTAIVDGDNVDTPDEPEHELLVYPRYPALESEKTSSIVEKGEGNSNVEAYQVGDTIEYTIRARNTVKESLLTNFRITDVLPEGLTLVEGSLEASNGGTADFTNGAITANFGDVQDIEWRTVTFQATIDSGQVGNILRNVATVEGDNLDEPDYPENEYTVEPREPVLESDKTFVLTEKAVGNTDETHPEVGDTLTYIILTRNSITDSLIENLTIRDHIPEGLEYIPGTIEVDGEIVTDEDDSDVGHNLNGEVVGQFGDITDTEWHTLSFQVIVGEGQASKDIINKAKVDGDNVDTPDEPEHELLVYPRYPALESEKTSSILEKGEGNSNAEAYQVGDTVEYIIRARNTVKESLVTNFGITDVLPTGLTFVEGSLEVSHEGTGEYTNGTITANFGDVSDTEWRTVTFQAIIDSGQVGNTLQNIATVDGDNLEVPDKPENEIIVEPRVPALE